MANSLIYYKNLVNGKDLTLSRVPCRSSSASIHVMLSCCCSFSSLSVVVVIVVVNYLTTFDLWLLEIAKCDLEEYRERAGKMSQQIKVLAENLSSIPWVHMVEEENRHLRIVHTQISCSIQRIKSK